MTKEDVINGLRLDVCEDCMDWVQGKCNYTDDCVVRAAIEIVDRYYEPAVWEPVEVCGYDGYKCSQCGEFIIKKSNHCPNCGRKMKCDE